MSRKAVAAMIALNALQGWFAPVPADMDVSEILAEFYEIGGLRLSDPPKEIAEKAQDIEESRVTYLAVNKFNGEIMITMLIDLPDERLTNEEEMLSRDGYAFAYVYNNSTPWCSEYGDVVVRKQPDRHIRRIG